MDINQYSVFTPDMIQNLRPTIPDVVPATTIQESRELFADVAEMLSEEAEQREAYRIAHLEAVQTTARETTEIRERQDKIIDNQNVLIEYQKAQIRALSEQLVYLQEIFSSDEQGTNAQKEILQRLIEQEENKHPVQEFLKDKGGDMGVAAITAVGKMLWPAMKAWLISKGINIP